MYISIFLSALFALFTTSCNNQNTSSQCDVLVSIPPYLYFVDKLTDGELKAESLVPAGANPHIYEPSPKQVSSAKQAKVWIRLGEGFEKKVLKSLQEQNPSLIVVNLAEKVSLPNLSGKPACKCCHHHEESLDLHFWLSLRLAKQQATFIAEALCQAFPERKDQIQKNLSSLQERLSKTDSFIVEKLLPFAGESILVSHPAFGYFCYDYKLKQLSIETEGKDPLPKDIAFILQCAQTTRIRTVLTQAQYNNKGAEIIAKDLNLLIHEVDPYSANYLDNILYIANCIENP